MKKTATVLFTCLLAIASVAKGDTYKTLVGYRDSLKIPAGQTVLVVSSTSNLVIGVERPGKRPHQFRFGELEGGVVNRIRVSSSRNFNLLPTPSVHNPVPIAGPATLIMRTDGLLTLSVPEKRRRSSVTSSGTARRFVQN